MTADSYTFNGMRARDRILVLQKECELLELERAGCKQVIAQLLQIVANVALTATQAHEVTAEIAERRRILRVILQRMEGRRASIKQFDKRDRAAKLRTQRAQDFHEERVAPCSP